MAVMQAFHFDTVDSTNDAARRLIAEGRLKGRGYVLARAQIAGRGTHGRSWISPRDAGVYLTVARTDAGPVSPDLQTLTLLVGTKCAKVVADTTGLTSIQLKPVNDLIIHGRKLGGILAECEIESGQLKSLVVGVGINVRVAERPLPAEALSPICLEDCLGPDSVNDALWARIIEGIVGQVDAAITDVLLGQE
jgi:BirA family transcriptional regulator, biotin operon repressor / biotin---[acetyl-CoA-carboxylase] ligase